MLTEEQKQLRCKGIGASDTPIIMGYSSYKSPYQLYLEKTGQLEPDDEETELQEWGKKIEPLILQKFAEVHDCKIQMSPDTVYHPDYPFMLAHLDGYSPDLDVVVEAKMANSFQRHLWDNSINDGMPMKYLIQVAKQCNLKKAKAGYCAVLIGGFEYREFLYERDTELEEMIEDADKQFWHCVENKLEPDVINLTDCKLKYRSVVTDKTIMSSFVTDEILKKLADVKSKTKELSKQEDSCKMAIMDYMKDAEYLADLDGKIIATWKANKKGTRVFNLKN